MHPPVMNLPNRIWSVSIKYWSTPVWAKKQKEKDILYAMNTYRTFPVYASYWKIPDISQYTISIELHIKFIMNFMSRWIVRFFHGRSTHYPKKQKITAGEKNRGFIINCGLQWPCLTKIASRYTLSILGWRNMMIVNSKTDFTNWLLFYGGWPCLYRFINFS